LIIELKEEIKIPDFDIVNFQLDFLKNRYLKIG